MYRYLQERIRQVEDERGHALSTISKYKVLINAIVAPGTVFLAVLHTVR